MHWFLSVALILVLALTAVLVLAKPGQAGEMDTTPLVTADPELSGVLRQAREEGRGVLLNFTGSDWCSWCVKLQEEVFDTPAFRAWAERRALLVDIDFPARGGQPQEVVSRNQILQSRYEIRGFPTIVVLDPEGRQRGQVGYVRGGPQAWIAEVERLLAPRA